MKIYSATAVTSKTKFYSASLDDVLKAYDNPDKNCWVYASLKEYGWDCIDFDNNLFGSAVVDDILYICVTDGKDIRVMDSWVDPEYALEDYVIDVLQDYIIPATDKIITRYISSYEIFKPDFDKLAPSLIKEREFLDMVRDMEDFE